MIGIKVISNTNIRNFELNLEKLLAEHPDAKVIFGAIKGIEGGKGLVVVFSYEKKEEPKPEVNEKVEARIRAKLKTAEIEKVKAAEKEAKKAELEKQLAEMK